MTRMYMTGNERQLPPIPGVRDKRAGYANRGIEFERCLEQMHELYKARGVGVVTKNYVRSTVVGDGKLARVDGSAIVDYTGCLEGGTFAAFDAKDCEGKSIALARLQPHQLEYLTDVGLKGGYAFILARFERQRVWRIPVHAWRAALAMHRFGGGMVVEGFEPTGKASINEKELPKAWAVKGYDWAGAFEK